MPIADSRKPKNMKPSTITSEDSFRDHFSGVSEDGKRNWFYPQKPKGVWHNRRILFTTAILTILSADECDPRQVAKSLARIVVVLDSRGLNVIWVWVFCMTASNPCAG